MADLNNDPFIQNQTEVIFKEQDVMKANEISNYIYWMKSTYTYLHLNLSDSAKTEIWNQIVGMSEKEINEDTMNQFAVSIKNQISDTGYLSSKKRRFLFHKDLGKDELYIKQITEGKSYEVVFVGIAVILTIAVILGGGKIDISALGFKIKAELPALAEGISKLKSLFKE